ncbi:MAG: tRNA pseudouridine(38-40) synthase TruA [Planctomycetes bacterium]|nr:tRNA pseudouridine(38-40) synthase TruA [Planctomycetota bacterium]MBI3845067.1 tRNA pseudouridine(38-40) synthase TruA [Planctomycetota bacterium]
MRSERKPRKPIRTIRLVIEYDGTEYVGWQRQLNGPTVQQRVEEAIRAVTGEAVVVHGSGRTDAGVHATGQVGHFRTTNGLPPDVFRRAINANLPDDVVVLRADEAPARFHSRFDAASKVYQYRIRNDDVRGALDRRVAWHVARRLDLASMRRAARVLIGRKDLRSFVAAGSSSSDAVRTIKSLDIRRTAPYILVTIQADGFLYKMVRTIVGTLVWVGSGKISPADFQAILDSRDRRRAGPTAPANGLTLSSVEYSDDFEIHRDRRRGTKSRDPKLHAKSRG